MFNLLELYKWTLGFDRTVLFWRRSIQFVMRYFLHVGKLYEAWIDKFRHLTLSDFWYGNKTVLFDVIVLLNVKFEMVVELVHATNVISLSINNNINTIVTASNCNGNNGYHTCISYTIDPNKTMYCIIFSIE